MGRRHVENTRMRRLNLSRAHLNFSYGYIAEIEFEMHAVPKAPKGTIIIKKERDTPSFKSKVFILPGFNSNRDSVILCDTKAQSFL